MSIWTVGRIASSIIAIAGALLASNAASAQPALATPKDVASCIGCHGMHGARARAHAPQPGIMTAVAATLDESQIQAAAAYLAQLSN